jgi:hypothetical protein
MTSGPDVEGLGDVEHREAVGEKAGKADEEAKIWRRESQHSRTEGDPTFATI